MKIEDVPVGQRFRVIDPESDDYGIVFTRTATGAKVVDVRSDEGWEDVEIIE